MRDRNFSSQQLTCLASASSSQNEIETVQGRVTLAVLCGLRHCMETWQGCLCSFWHSAFYGRLPTHHRFPCHADARLEDNHVGGDEPLGEYKKTLAAACEEGVASSANIQKPFPVTGQIQQTCWLLVISACISGKENASDRNAGLVKPGTRNERTPAWLH